MKTLVTGANGYLGQGNVKHLLDIIHYVVATDFNVDYVDDRADRVERFIKENGYKNKLVYGAFPERHCDSKAV